MILTAPSRPVLTRTRPGRTRPGGIARPRTAPGMTAPGMTAQACVLALLSGLCLLTGHSLLVPSGPPALVVTMLAGAVLAGALAACLAGGAGRARLAAGVPLVSRAAALREKSWRAAFTRLRDPDAAGRPRPRAPSAAPAAARFSRL
jgi:Family of unknown function (DUF6412)